MQTSQSRSPSPQPASATNLPKDRPCPFCNQAFTSSSLGRHLDLYIRERNPKPSDGIHNVEEIKALRQRITRRQPRRGGSGLKRKASSDAIDGPERAAGEATGHDKDEQSATVAGVNEAVTSSYAETMSAADFADIPWHPLNVNVPVYPDPKKPNGIIEFVGIPNLPQRFQHPAIGTSSRMAWRVTGVLNDGSAVEARPTDSGLPPALANDGGPDQPASNDKAKAQPTSEESTPDDDRVAKAALHDILNSLQRAHTRITQPSTFSFDPLALNYPALCLRLLQAPESLFSPTPMEPATDPHHYWPLRDAPSAAHKARLIQSIRTRLKVHLSLCPPSELRFADTRREVEAGILAEANKQCAKYIAHVDAALEQWEAFSQPTRDEIWRLELLRYCSTQQTENYNLERKLERTQDFVEELRVELARLREANVKLASRKDTASGGQSSSNGLLNGSSDATHPALGPIVDSAMSRELEEMWTVGAIGGGGGWMDGAGSGKWKFDHIMKRYRALVQAGKGENTLWPGDAWRDSHRDAPVRPDDTSASERTNGAPAAHSQVESISMMPRVGYGPAVTDTWRLEDLVRRGGTGWTPEDLAKRGVG